MAASPISSVDGDEPTPHAATLTEWLRSRDDRQLAQLLRLRPDLGLPAAPDIGSLASRIGVRTSTQRSVDTLDAHTLRTLENLVLAAGAGDTALDAAAVLPPTDDIAARLAPLFDRALIWGDPQSTHLTPTVRDAVGPYPAGLGRPAAALFPLVSDGQLVPVLRHLGVPPAAQPRAGATVAAHLADPQWLAGELALLDDEERAVLDRLAAGPPVGTVRNTRAPDGDQSAPHRLLARGLLVAIDNQRVELPREVGRAIRASGAAAGQPTVSSTEPPFVRLTERDPIELDRLGTTAVLELLRLVDSLTDSWTAHPPAMLRSGGLGVRELKRTAKDLGTDEATAALVAEILYAASLVNASSGPEPVFLPTTDFDAWRTRDSAQRWTVLASAWLLMTRQPSLVSQRGERDRVITALGPDAERGTIPSLRRQVLDLLAALPPGSSPADRAEVLAQFTWYQPRRAAGQVPLVAAILAEADLLGVTAAGGLTGYTRTLVAAGHGSAGGASANGASGSSTAAAEHALDRALPDPVDHFLVQPDLTIVVPGPPEPSLGLELGLIADLESTGGASVYRITERSVRRALDAGRSGVELAAFVTEHSRTPVPQALQYLIDDAARRHGVLRAGTAGAYLRCDDESLLTRVLSDRSVSALNLRLIAPTVAIADAPVTQVLDVLREGGFAPAAESPDGELITLGFDPPRSPSRPASRTITSRGVAGTEKQVAELVRRLRSGDALAGGDSRVQAIARDIPGVTSAATMELLRAAVSGAKMIWFGAAEANGTATAHTMQPISLAAGTLRGYERGQTGLSAYPVHRITAIRILDEPDDGSLDASGRPDERDG